MNWENKFSSILREAESNLAKSRKKFPTDSRNLDWKYGKFSASVPMRRASSLYDITGPLLESSFHQGGYAPSSFMPSQNYDIYTSTMASQNAASSSLQDKLDQQNKLIEQLMQMVNKMEHERNNYDQQIRDLKNDMYELKSRSMERNPNVENRLDQVKRELRSDIQLLQTQLQYYRNAKGDNSISDSHVSLLERDISDLRNGMKDDLELLRRDIEIVKTRMNKLELDVGAVLSNRKVIEQQQSRLDRMIDEAHQEIKTMQSLTSTSFRPPFSTSHLLNNTHATQTTHSSQWNNHKDGGRHQIHELRSTVASLRDKIDQMEYAISTVSGGSTPKPLYINSGIGMAKSNPYLNAGTSTPLSTHLNGYGGIKSEKSDNSVMDLGDLSDEESTDFEMFNPKTNGVKRSAIKKSTAVGLGLDDDDGDLDLSDLDLSDDESLQNGMI